MSFSFRSCLYKHHPSCPTTLAWLPLRLTNSLSDSKWPIFTTERLYCYSTLLAQQLEALAQIRQVNTGVCVNVSISNTRTIADSATGPQQGIAVGSSCCYPTAGRYIPCRPNDRVSHIGVCFPVFHYFVRR